MSFHSHCTHLRPCSRNRRMPRLSLICPNTGSTVILRRVYRALPGNPGNPGTGTCEKKHKLLCCSLQSRYTASVKDAATPPRFDYDQSQSDGFSICGCRETEEALEKMKTGDLSPFFLSPFFPDPVRPMSRKSSLSNGPHNQPLTSSLSFSSFAALRCLEPPDQRDQVWFIRFCTRSRYT